MDVHTSTPGTGPEAASGPPDRTLLEAEYRRYGGTRLQLPWGGCEVHLVPVSFYDRRPVRAEAASLHYPGLLTLRYRFVRAQPAPAEPPARRWRSAPPPTPAGPALSYLELMHVTDGRGGGGPLQVPVSLTMTTHSQRLPLSVPDAENRLGTNVVVLGTDRSSGWVPVGGPMDLSRYAGHYVRVFASIEGPPGMEVALLDPSLDALRAR